MPKPRRQDIYRLQAHALSDALGRCRGTIPVGRRHEDEWARLICPLCLRWYSFADLDEDHAPQKAGQSHLGSAVVVVMTCRADNQRSGGTYEAKAHALKRDLAPVPEPLCTLHQRERVTKSGLVVSLDRTAFDLTDVRAAYLIAFATLGYRWAMSSRLDKLREGLASADLRYAATDYDITCAHDVPGLEPFHVYEVTAPVTAVLVTGDHASVLLPAHGSATNISGLIARPMSSLTGAGSNSTAISVRFESSRRWPWPQQFTGPGGTPEKAWDVIDTGNLFHYDRCTRADHHVNHALSSSELAATVGALAAHRT